MTTDEHDAGPADDDTIGSTQEVLALAISGGGVRAALYALGAILYLGHSGLNQRVRIISSVSGGSLLNAVLALSGDFSRMSPPDLNRIAQRVAFQLANRGVFFSRGVRFLIGLAILAILMLEFTASKAVQGQSQNTVLNWVEDHAFLYLTGTIVAIFFAALWLRAIVQIGTFEYFLEKCLPCSDGPGGTGGRRRGWAAYDWLIRTSSACFAVGRPTRGRARTSLRDFSPSSVHHVLCATELTSGKPFYMRAGAVYSDSYGSAPSSMAVCEAIYASAAFPVVFPPLRVNVNKLDLAGGLIHDRPKRLVLADGGVFNNLGTDTLLSLPELSTSSVTGDAAMPRLPDFDRVMIINASAPTKIGRLPRSAVLRQFAAAFRVVTILYDNTVKPRIQHLSDSTQQSAGVIVLDIGETPSEYAQRFASKNATSAASLRARAVIEQLHSIAPDSFWRSMTISNSYVKTVLSAIGGPAGSRLVRYGYIDAAVACHIQLGSHSVDDVPDERWFNQLTRRPRGRDQI